MTSTDRQTVIKFPSKELEITEGIVSNSLLLTEILIADNNIGIGGYNSNKFEVDLYGIDEDVSGLFVEVYQIVDGADRINLFSGYVDECSTVDKNTKHIVAYDLLYHYKNYDVKNAVISYFEQHTVNHELQKINLVDLIQSIMATVSTQLQLGKHPNFSIEPYKFTASSLDVSSWKFANNISSKFSAYNIYTLESFLNDISELLLCNVNCGRDGKIDLVGYLGYGRGYRPNINIGDNYDKSSAVIQNYKAPMVNGFYTGTVGSLGDDEKNVFIVTDNDFFNASESYTLYVYNERYKSLLIGPSSTFIPAELNLNISDLNIEVGDYVTFIHEEKEITTYIMQQELSGPLLIEQRITSNCDRNMDNTNYKDINEQSKKSNLWVDDNNINLGTDDDEMNIIIGNSNKSLVLRGNNLPWIYHKGDVVNIRGNYSGHLTGGNKNIVFSISLPKEIDSSVTKASLKVVVTARCNGTYILNNKSITLSITLDESARQCGNLVFTYISSTSLGATNNAAVDVWIANGGTITFN